MKKMMIISLLIVGIIGCKKSSTQSNKTSSNSSTTSTQTPMNNVGMAESALIGHWVSDSAVYYNNNVVSNVQVCSAANANDFTYDVVSTFYSGGASYWKQITYQRTGQASMATYWYVTDVYFNSTGLLSLQSGGAGYFGGYIISISSNHLVTSGNTGSVKQGQYYYFPK
jgi:hypothetical protein